jgi:hypothetical protein
VEKEVPDPNNHLFKAVGAALGASRTLTSSLSLWGG